MDPMIDIEKKNLMLLDARLQCLKYHNEWSHTTFNGENKGVDLRDKRIMETNVKAMKHSILYTQPKKNSTKYPHAKRPRRFGIS